MRSRLSLRAQNDLARIRAWWERELGVPPLKLREELRATMRLLERFPEAGVEYGRSGSFIIYRILLRDSQQHVYYRIEPDLIRVVTIWSTARERGPRFRAPS